MQLRLVIALVLVSLLLLFTVQNAKTVDIAFVFWHVEMSRALLIFVVFVLGGVVGWFLRTSDQHRKRADKHLKASTQDENG